MPENKFPVFDLIMLGIGEEGHTASLFPGDPAISEKKRLAVAVSSKKLQHDRISLTLPVINNAEDIVFLVTGESKANIAQVILEENKTNLQASMVNPRHGELFYLLDKNAASLLSDISHKLGGS